MILERITRGQGVPEDIKTLENLATLIKSTALCGLGQTAPNPILTTIRYFRDEFEAEIEEGKQPEQEGMIYVTAPCIEACPSKINVPQYIDYIRDGKPENSLGVLLQKYPMAATCGRVTVAEVEEIVETGDIAPDDVHLPGIYVHRIVHNPTPEKRIEKRTTRDRKV